jgi:hypothetical protein
LVEEEVSDISVAGAPWFNQVEGLKAGWRLAALAQGAEDLSLHALGEHGELLS